MKTIERKTTTTTFTEEVTSETIVETADDGEKGFKRFLLNCLSLFPKLLKQFQSLWTNNG